MRRENTIEAFLEARHLGADGVELDVRRSADGALVVHHDAALPDGRPIAATRVSELPDHVPLLEAALDACAGLIVNVEIKNLPTEPGYDPSETVAADVADLAVARAAHPGAGFIAVSAFTLASVDAVHRVAPEVATGWLVPSAFDQMQAVATASEHGHGAVHPHHSVVSEELVTAAHECGLAVVVWTVDAPEDLRRVARAGVDTIITNVPDVARDVLSRP